MKKINRYALAIAALVICSWAAAQEKETNAKAAAPHHAIMDPASLTWGDAPPGLPAGAKVAVLDGDPGKKGPFTIRLRALDGYKVSPHTHPTAERITVISGTFVLGTGDKFDESAGQQMAPGAFTSMPAGMKHFAWMKGETIIQVHGEGPFEIVYVNPADDPRKQKK